MLLQKLRMNMSLVIQSTFLFLARHLLCQVTAVTAAVSVQSLCPGISTARDGGHYSSFWCFQVLQKLSSSSKVRKEHRLESSATSPIFSSRHTEVAVIFKLSCFQLFIISGERQSEVQKKCYCRS